MLVLVDNNFAQREGMREYLAASPDNKVAISQTLMEEWHKRDAARNTRRLLKIACRFPRQIVMLKDTAEIMHMHGRPHCLLLRLVDRQQTRNFAAYCDTVINAPLSAAIEAQFAAYEEEIGQRMEALTGQAHKMMELFAKWDDPSEDAAFTPAELREMRGIVERDVRLSPDLQHKTLLKAIEQAAAQFRGHGVDRRHVPQDLQEVANLLSFRYGAMMVGLYVFWRNRPGPYPKSDKAALNWLNDLKIAAQATYFEGFRTCEKRLQPVYEIGLGLIKALGGYTNCGRNETFDQLLAHSA